MTSTIALAAIAMHRMAGGLERNLAYLANDLAEAGHRVVVMTFDPPGAEAFYPLDPRVHWERLDGRPHAPITMTGRLALIGRMRRALLAHDVRQIVCFHHGLLIRYLIASLGLGVRMICSERNALDLYRFTSTPRLNLNYLALRLADRVTVQFPRYADAYPAAVRARISVVHNPVWPTTLPPRPRKPVILSVGRHSKQKRFGMLIRAFAELAAEFPSWSLCIIGDGPYLEEVRQLAADLGVADRVTFLGPTSDVAEHMAEATLYCQPSEWEGFPNALAEAMANGAVPVGFADTAGVRDLIRHDLDGHLVEGPPDASSLSAGLRHMMRATDLQQRSEQARTIVDRYSVSSWRAAWRSVLGLARAGA